MLVNSNLIKALCCTYNQAEGKRDFIQVGPLWDTMMTSTEVSVGIQYDNNLLKILKGKL